MFWDEHSVRLLGELVESCPRWIDDGYVTTIPSHRVYFPLWNEIEVIYRTSGYPEGKRLFGYPELHESQPEMLFFHLWTSSNKNVRAARERRSNPDLPSAVA